MRRVFLASVLVWLGFAFLAPGVMAVDDPMQRKLRFKNDFPFTIYPVIKATREDNCKDGPGQLRIVVNLGARGMGIPSGQTLDVNIPKHQPCPNSGFYKSGRVYIFAVNLEAYEPRISQNQRTVDINAPWATDACPACWVGTAGTDYPLDAPFVLAEYTIEALGLDGKPVPDPNDPTATPLFDYDLSFVDSAFLPAALGPAEGLSPFMGTALTYEQFRTRLNDFLADTNANWSKWAAYNPVNWPTATFQDLVPQPSHPAQPPELAHVPAGFNVIHLTRKEHPGALLPGTSSYKPVAPWDPTVGKQCKQPPPDNQACYNITGKDGNCCPQTNDQGTIMLGCCDIQNWIVDRTKQQFTRGTNKTTFLNPTRDNLVGRFTPWAQHKYNCAFPPANPAADQPAFCKAFQRTFDFVWNEFTTHRTSIKDEDDCQTQKPFLTAEEYQQCVVAAIVGFTIITDFNPDACKETCPGPNCPKQCTDQTQRSESVIALLRSVPWGAYGPANTCGGCPSLDESQCPHIQCIATLPPASDSAPLYHWDGFLHFSAPFDSPYNLNPWARFVHDDAGLAAKGTYSFSIDDFYGNFGGIGSTLVVNTGGTSALTNKEPRNPYKQYLATPGFNPEGPNWDHARVCGRRFKAKNAGLPVSFWKGKVGDPAKFCEVVFYKDAAETDYVVFLLQEIQFDVIDSYRDGPPAGELGKNKFPVQGLSGASSWGGGTFIARPGDLTNPPNDAYCMAHATQAMKDAGMCVAKLTPHGNDQAYVGVKECAAGHNFDATCGRPLMNLILPALPKQP